MPLIHRIGEKGQPDDSFVYHGEGYDMPGELKDWAEGDTWAEHEDAVARVVLPTVTFDVLIFDHNPEHAQWVSEEAKTDRKSVV